MVIPDMIGLKFLFIMVEACPVFIEDGMVGINLANLFLLEHFAPHVKGSK